MITSNIYINNNKLEEFIRVLLNEHYDILHSDTQNVTINVEENTENIIVNSTLTEKNNVKSVQLIYKKIHKKYFDQSEVMAKTSLLKLFNKEKKYDWGALIGVRPTKIVRRFLSMNLSYEEIENILLNIYFVSKKKVDLLIKICQNQEKYLDKETIGIYIGVAFCPTKCTYCSFPAYLLKGKYKEKYVDYINTLYEETKEIGLLTKELNLKINTIYIGGGTPSILTEKEIEDLLNIIKENYNLSYLKEFTFEAGRIDTLNEKKLQILKNNGVNKISINPQSFNEKTLKLVNRYHNREQFDNVYNIAKKVGLEINMDLILGLPKETTEDILYTMDEILKYNMENLTIHNLAIKNASKLNKDNYIHENSLDYKKIYEKIDDVVNNKGLQPYYMYRQKNSFSWGENLGYCTKNNESIYNIEMIEENKTIIGIGAGSITKLISYNYEKEKDDIERVVNPKDPLVYIMEIKERLQNKREKIINLYK